MMGIKSIVTDWKECIFVIDTVNQLLYCDCLLVSGQ